MLKFLIIFIGVVVFAEFNENCNAPDAARDCENVCYEALTACIVACDPSDVSCPSNCLRDQEECIKDCPCHDNCLEGCPCDTYDCELPSTCEERFETEIKNCNNQCNVAVLDEIKACTEACSELDCMIECYEIDERLEDCTKGCPCAQKCEEGCPCEDTCQASASTYLILNGQTVNNPALLLTWPLSQETVI